MESGWGIHWFRRDLRLPNNRALNLNLRRTQSRTVGLFCFDSKFLSRDDFSHRRFAFFIETMKQLRAEMKSYGGELLVLDMAPADAFKKIIQQCRAEERELPFVTFNRDYEPYARDRDSKILSTLKDLGVECKTRRDHVLFEPHEILKGDGSAYQKYSAYAHAWQKLLVTEKGQKRVKRQSRSQAYFKGDHAVGHFKLKWKNALKHLPHGFEDQLDIFEKQNGEKYQGSLPEAGFKIAYQSVLDFASHLKTYNTERSIPSVKGSSEFSKFLKNGSLTIAQVIHALKLNEQSIDVYDGHGKFLKELIWREYYYYILNHYPRVEKEAFLERYGDLKWNTSRADFKRWCEGKTGVPIVDAGMRELNTSGWINNRIRIIVATFLTKDLLINWQWGEQYFMNQLIDGDVAANNGNWQWVGSTGSENQPYFRVMNPWLQGERFDKDGMYIKRWLPELAECDARDLHDESSDRSSYGGYPAPMVKHDGAKKDAIALFKNAGVR